MCGSPRIYLVIVDRQSQPIATGVFNPGPFKYSKTPDGCRNDELKVGWLLACVQNKWACSMTPMKRSKKHVTSIPNQISIPHGHLSSWKFRVLCLIFKNSPFMRSTSWGEIDRCSAAFIEDPIRTKRKSNDERGGSLPLTPPMWPGARERSWYKGIIKKNEARKHHPLLLLSLSFATKDQWNPSHSCFPRPPPYRTPELHQLAIVRLGPLLQGLCLKHLHCLSLPKRRQDISHLLKVSDS